MELFAADQVLPETVGEGSREEAVRSASLAEAFVCGAAGRVDERAWQRS